MDIQTPLQVRSMRKMYEPYEKERWGNNLRAMVSRAKRDGWYHKNKGQAEPGDTESQGLNDSKFLVKKCGVMR